MEQEIWKPILNYDGYEVSNTGKVRSLLFSNKSRSEGGYLLKQRKLYYLDRKGRKRTPYIQYRLRKNGKDNYVMLHRILAIAFIPNPKNKPQINHIDGNSLNNSLNNLEWCTPKENVHHAIRLGLKKEFNLGEKNYWSVFTAQQVLEIFNSNITHSKLAIIYNVHQATIASIKCGNTWSHVTGLKYNRKRFTKRIVLKIRIEAEYMTVKELSKKYNKDTDHIKNILSRKHWRNV